MLGKKFLYLFVRYKKKFAKTVSSRVKQSYATVKNWFLFFSLKAFIWTSIGLLISVENVAD